MARPLPQLREFQGIQTVRDPQQARDHSWVWLYGDSFLVGASQDQPTWWTLITQPRPCIMDQSEPGSGVERAIWLWSRDHQQGLHRQGDRVIMALSEPTRLFHSQLPGINAGSAVCPPDRHPAWPAIKSYYEQISYHTLEIMPLRQQALHAWLDRELAQSPAETWVAQSFPTYKDPHQSWEISRDLQLNVYAHWFQNARNIWPSLMYFSATDPEFPGTIANDRRVGHMSLQQHHRIFRTMRQQQRQGQRDFLLCDPPQGQTPIYDLRRDFVTRSAAENF